LSNITTALRPAFASVYSDKDIVGLSKLYTFGLKTSVFLGLWIFFVLVTVGPNFVIEWVGEDNYVGDQVFYLMALYMLVNILIVPSDSLLMGTNHQKSYGIMMVIEGILNVSLSVWWIQTWGLAGVIGATVVARCCTNGWFCLYKAFRITDYSVSKIFVEILRPILPSLLLTTLTAYLLLLANLVGWEKIIIHTFGLTFVYIFSYFFFAVKKESKDKLFTMFFAKRDNRR
jgi:O-antigen/teichoic acid export membrane protein